MQFTVKGDEINRVPTDKGEWVTRRLTLLGKTEFDQQFCELNLPENHPAVGVDKVVDIRVRKVLSVFQGNARIVGDLLQIDGKPVTK